jgi:RNA polymerase sigma-70 factor (sigma-E family)
MSTAADEVRQVEAGSRDTAIAALFAQQYRPLTRTAFLLLGDRQAAEEVTQDAFVALFGRWDRLDDLAAAPRYLRTSVVNGCRSWMRRAVRRRQRSALVLVADETRDAIDDHGGVTAALARLSRRQRECLVLRFYLDLSEADVARSLGISKGSVKAHTHRGLTAMASMLGDQEL